MDEPSLSTVKRLFAVSGNRCAFPRCTQPLVDAGSGKVVGRVCHIKGKSPGGPRYDPSQSGDERHGFENLILLCPVHHDVIDADEESYTVERLLKMKANHQQDPNDSLDLSDEQAVGFIVPQQPTLSTTHNTAIYGSNITTINQMGGQAAHSITNIGPQPRVLSGAAANEIARSIRDFSPQAVKVTALMGDPESYQFADVLQGILRQAGWECDGINQAVFSGLPRGVILKMSEKSPSMVALGEALLRVRISCHGELDAKATTPDVIVGSNL